MDMTEEKSCFHNETILDKKRQSPSRKLARLDSPDAQLSVQSCPQCGSDRLYRDGLRYQRDGSSVQRWLCRSCGYRFSEAKVKLNVTSQVTKTFDSGKHHRHRRVTAFNLAVKESANKPSFSFSENVASHGISTVEEGLFGLPSSISGSQVCVKQECTKNLTSSTETKTVVGEGKPTSDIKGKIVEFAWYLQKEGFAESTIRRYIQSCHTLINQGADLFTPESVKEVIAKQKWQEITKLNYVNFYDTLAKFLSLKWERPRYAATAPLPWIPLESEIDLLIHGTGKKLSTILQIIKETAMRIGEVLRLRWIDIDAERNLISMNLSEKHGKSGIYRVSPQLIQRILLLPKKKDEIFGSRNAGSLEHYYAIIRRRLAREYNNARLERIHFHTIRHWKATVEYHKTKDILHVKELLRHKSLDNTLIYIHLEKALYGESDSQEFTVKVAHDLNEACELLKVGFEFVTDMENVKLFRKRK